ncbi:MAG: TrmH family RNA methyltransferase [Bacteroidales bacterium]
MDNLTVNYIHDVNLRRSFIDYLSALVLEKRLALFKKNLRNRTRYIAVVLEDIYQSQNASAVLRTCDCLGIQDIHVIENENQFSVNSEVDMGASKWLNIYRYNGELNNTSCAIRVLKEKGYRIVATTPHDEGISIRDFNVEKGKFALFFGTELTGLSDNAIAMADEYVKIPMYGFTESYNISVSVALSLYEFVHRLRGAKADLSVPNDEAELILLAWLRASIKGCNLVEKRFLEEYFK